MSVGVYELGHATSGYVYVGSSTDLERREFHWRLIFDRARGRPIPYVHRRVKLTTTWRFDAALADVGPEGWSFAVCLPFGEEELALPYWRELLWSSECRCIQLAFEKVGKDRLLNAYDPSPTCRYPFGLRPTYLQERFRR